MHRKNLEEYMKAGELLQEQIEKFFTLKVDNKHHVLEKMLKARSRRLMDLELKLGIGFADALSSHIVDALDLDGEDGD